MLRYYPSIFLEKLKDTRLQGRESNYIYEAEMLTF
jgi:hypothetical protein